MRIKDVYHHFEAVHSEKTVKESRYKCSICDNSYAHKFHLYDHERKKHHTKVNRHDCGMCEKTFSEIVNLNVHMKEQHDSMSSAFQV